jgi:hypothetical protein
VVDFVEATSDPEEQCDVLFDVLENRVFLQVGHVLPGARAQVVDADNAIALREETFAEVAA